MLAQTFVYATSGCPVIRRQPRGQLSCFAVFQITRSCRPVIQSQEAGDPKWMERCNLRLLAEKPFQSSWALSRL